MFSIKSFENLFRYRRQIEVDLKNFSLKDIVNFPYKSEAGSSEYFIQERLNDNQLIVNYHRGKAWTGGIHYISYLPEQSHVVIESLPEKRDLHRCLFLLGIFPILLIFGKSIWAFFWISIIAVNSFFWIWGVRDESAELRRELTIRINYALRTGRKVNVID